MRYSNKNWRLETEDDIDQSNIVAMRSIQLLGEHLELGKSHFTVSYCRDFVIDNRTAFNLSNKLIKRFLLNHYSKIVFFTYPKHDNGYF